MFIKAICFILNLWGILFLGIHYGYGQNNVLATQVSLPDRSYSVHELTQTIQWQAEVSFSYNSKEINSAQKIVIQRHQTDLVSLLHYLKVNYGITSRIAGGHVVFIPGPGYTGNKKLKREKKKIAKRNRKKQKVQERKANLLREKREKEIELQNGAHPAPVQTSDPRDSMAFIQEITAQDEALKQYYLELGPRDQLQRLSGNVNSLEKRARDFNAHKGIRKSMMINMAAYADENFFFNPQLEFGYKYLYLTGTYALHRDLSHPRWGAGVLVPVTEKVSIRIFGNFGKFKKATNFFYDLTPRDTSPVDPVIYSGDYITKGNLLKVGITFEYRFSKYFSATLSPVWNQLSTRFLQNNNPVSLMSLLPAGEVGIREEDVQLLQRSILITHNTFSLSQTQYQRNWFGIQIGICMRLFGN
ncbi:MAG: hypothetical protein KL787_03535 [Taibaiella sp.]|nr:hypothetical protein [Taibaiella sp.]